MGSLAPDQPPKRELHVLVTGFGPFGPNPKNPSHPIALSFPSTLPHPHLSIQIHTLPAPIRVSYAAVRDLAPRLLFSSAPNPQSATSKYEPPAAPTPFQTQPRPLPPAPSPADSGLERPVFDIVLFIGMAGRRKYYAVESQAHRGPFRQKDVEGRTMEGDEYWTSGAFEGCPEVLRSGFDVLGEREGGMGRGRGVGVRWRERVGHLADVRTSTDAGRYLCDFIYFSGLAEYWRRGLVAESPVVFLHVPGETEAEDIERGNRVAEALIVTLVEEWWWWQAKEGRSVGGGR